MNNKQRKFMLFGGILASLIAIGYIFSISGAEVKAAEPEVVNNLMVEINEENFPDEVFRTYIFEKLDLGKDGWLYDDDIKDATLIDVRDMGIKSLEGIEFFTNLKFLYCNGNELEELDISCNSELSDLYCYGNKLKRLVFGENYCLRILACNENELETLDVSGLWMLEYLFCQTNKLTELKFGGNRRLTYVRCSGNSLKELNLTETPNLTYLYCRVNELETINFGEQDNYIYFIDAMWNKISDIDLSRCPYLLELYIRDNSLSKLDLSHNPRLSKLNCSINMLDELNLSNNNLITRLICSNNKIQSLDLKNLIYLEEFECSYNPIAELDISNNKVLDTIECKGTQVRELDITEDLYLQTIFGKTDEDCVIIDNFEPVAIDEEKFPDEGLREYLSVFDYNKDTLLDRTEFRMVTFNRLLFTEITDFTGCDIFIGCKDINIKTLGLPGFDFSRFLRLETLRCSGNAFTELDISHNPNLIRLECGGNNLSSLDVSENSRLQFLLCSGNENLTELDIEKCPRLRAVYMSGTSYSPSLQSYAATTEFAYNSDCGGEKESFEMILSYSDPTTILINPGYIFKQEESISGPLEINGDTPLELELKMSGEDLKYCWQYSRLGYDGWKTLSYQNPVQIEDSFLENAFYMNLRCIVSDKYGCFKIISLPRIVINDGSGALIDKTYFPDEMFRTFVKKYDSNRDYFLSKEEIAEVTSISIPSRSGITDLSGIEYFKNLESLSLDGVVDSECLNLSSNSELKSFSGNNCKIKKIIFGTNEKLESINISGGALESLVIDKLSGLKKLSVTNSGLSTLDVSGNTAITVLNCDNNKLTKLDVSKNKALEELKCNYNKLTSLIIGENTVLKTLDCGLNSLKKLDITKNTGLVTLNAYDNELDELDISNNLLLRKLKVRENSLKELDISRHADLMSLDCAFNKITALEFYRESGKNNTLVEIFCESNKLSSLNITGLDSLVMLSCYDNKSMGFLYLGGAETMRYLWDNHETDKTFKEVKEHAYDCSVYYYFIKSIQNGENENSRIVLQHDMQIILSTEVTYRLQIEEDLKDECVQKDESAVFKVSVTGKGLIYRWYYMDKDGTEWTELEGTEVEDMRINTSEDLTSSELTVGYLKSRNGMHVKCVLSDAYGQSLESSEAVLTYPSGIPSQSGETTPGGTPSQSGEATPGGTPSQSGETTPGGTPSQSGEATPSGTSQSGETTPGGTPSQSGETTPSGTPSQSGETTPGGTSQSGESTPSGNPSQSGESTPSGEDEKGMAGDVNGDGVINSKDVTELRRYLAGGWKVNVIEKNADINGDGVINAKDVTMLRRYLAGGWGVVLS